MADKDMLFWEEIDSKIFDIIGVIRAKYPKFNGTPVEKVIALLYDAYKSVGDVCDAIDKGWL
jgi:ribosome-interacting GTPase 1